MDLNAQSLVRMITHSNQALSIEGNEMPDFEAKKCFLRAQKALFVVDLKS